MSEPKKSSALVFWLGCATVAFVLMLVAVGGIMWWMLRRESATARANQAPPVGWRDSLHARYRLPPEVTQLALPRTEDGNAAELLGSGVPRGPDSLARPRMLASMHVLNNTPRTAEDAATIRRTFADSTLDRFVRAARQRRYEVRLPTVDSIAALYPPLGSGPYISNLSHVSRASVGLALRIRARLERRDLTLARTEIGALLGVGALLWRHETSTWGLIVARSLVRDGARELKRYAELARDTAAAAQATVMEQWASSTRTRPFLGFIFAYPDTAMVVAADTSLPRGVRAEALRVGVQGAVLSPLSRMILGPSRRAVQAVRALESDADPFVARAALIGDSTLTKLDRMGIGGRARLLLGLARSH